MADKNSPLWWDCDARGCWNTFFRPDLNLFAEVLPRNMGFSDIDAVTEIKGRFLFMEWKSHDGEIPIGQRVLFQQLTRLSRKIRVAIVVGDCKKMDVSSVQFIWWGMVYPREECDLPGLISRVAEWAEKADSAT